MSHILQVSVSFSSRCPNVIRHNPLPGISELSPDNVSNSQATADESLAYQAFMQIENAKLRHQIVDLVEQIADE